MFANPWSQIFSLRGPNGLWVALYQDYKILYSSQTVPLHWTKLLLVLKWLRWVIQGHHVLFVWFLLKYCWICFFCSRNRVQGEEDSSEDRNIRLRCKFIGPVKHKNQSKIVISFLSISLNMCFGCSKEPSHWDGSFECLKHMFWWRNENVIFRYTLLSWGLKL